MSRSSRLKSLTWYSARLEGAAKAGTTKVESIFSPAKSAADNAAPSTAQRSGTRPTSTGKSSGGAITNKMAARSAPRLP